MSVATLPPNVSSLFYPDDGGSDSCETLVHHSLLGNIVHEKMKNPRNPWRSTNTTALSYHQRPYVGEWSGMPLLENVILSCLVTRIKPVNVGTDTSIKPFKVIFYFITAFCRLGQGRQCTYNVTSRRVCATIVAVEKQ